MASPRTYASGDVIVIGAPPQTLRDVYHQFLRVSWSTALGAIAVVWLFINGVFGGVYVAIGGVAGARPRSFWDAFCFSVQTMGTIGYGSMYPTSVAANVCMTVESVTGLVVTALATGLIFAKFSRSTARVVFAHHVVIGPMDGVPTLMIRVGNERGNSILEATIRLVLIRTEKLKEGTTFYRMVDLKLTRERSPAMARSWTVLHPITPDSPLYGTTPESLAQDEVELVVTLVGTDDTSLQAVHARARYTDRDILWGARHSDILSEGRDGRLTLDVRRFHEVEATAAIDGFPYPRADSRRILEA
jgi:inward rectifier potassium channel